MLPVERAIFDLTSVVIGQEFAGRRLTEGTPGIGKWSAGGNPGCDQVPGAAEQRYRKLLGRKARSVDDRLVIAGEKARRIAKLANSYRQKIRLEELSRCYLIKPPSPDGAGTYLFERGGSPSQTEDERAIRSDD